MTTTAAAALKRTPLFDAHVRASGRMVPFAGWEMPVQYEGVIAEHRQVRQSAGLFDVSHMGQLVVSGSGAAADLQRLLSNDLRKLTDTRMAQYSLLMNAAGGIEDDLIVYRQGDDRFLLVVNASNVEHDAALLSAGVGVDTSVEDVSTQYAMLALQGPLALDVLAERAQVDVRELDTFRFVEADVAGSSVIVATTGYTGERGCELLVAAGEAETLWELLLQDPRVQPCGLGARDTLRLEVCYPLHGNDIGPSTDAVEAGLGWTCGWDTEFVGRDALQRTREHGPRRRLVPLLATGRGIPRAGCPVLRDDECVGEVTSGTMSPSLGTGIALAYVRSDHAELGNELELDVRGRRCAVQVAARPLYRAG